MSSRGRLLLCVLLWSFDPDLCAESPGRSLLQGLDTLKGCSGEYSASEFTAEAERLLEKTFECISDSPDSALPYLVKGELNLLRGRNYTAVADLEHCLDLDPKNVRARLALSRTLINLGKTEEARLLIEDGIDRLGGVLELEFALAVCLSRLEELESAIDVLLRLRGRDASSRPVADLLLELSLETGDIATAQSVLESLVASGDLLAWKAKVLLLDAALNHGYVAVSRKLLSELKRLEADIDVMRIREARFWSLNAEIAKDEQGFSRAALFLEKALELDPLREEYVVGLGEMYLKAGDGSRAIQKLKLLWDAPPADVEYYILLSKAYLAEGESQRAGIALRGARDYAVKIGDESAVLRLDQEIESLISSMSKDEADVSGGR